MIKSIIIILVSCFSLLAQTYYYESSVGNFQKAVSFFINPAGYFLVTDERTNEIIKVDTLGKEIIRLGGYGWTERTFDDPIDVYADALLVYVTDYNNHRIQRFDKDLNFTFSLSNRSDNNPEESFGYPLSCLPSAQGDIFILDSENKRIVKFDMFGKFKQNFGGYDAGIYSLAKPKKLGISSRNNIYVLDGKRMIIFDQFGNGMNIIEMSEPFNDLKILFDKLVLSSKDNIQLADLKSPELVLNTPVLEGYDLKGKIKSAIFFNNKIFVLTDKQIHRFVRQKKN